MLLSGCFLVVAPLCCNSAEAVLQEPGEANDVLSKSSNISSPATTITPDEFIRELRGWRSNIFNLRLKWKKSSPDESRYGGYVIPDSEIDGYFSIQEFVWEDSGSMTTDIQSFRNNVKTYRQTRGWSTVESMSFDANYNHSNGVGVISKILLEPMASNQAYSNIGIRPLQVGSALEIPIGFPIC